MENIQKNSDLMTNDTRLEKLYDCLLTLDADPDRNINLLTMLCGELMHATCALYSHINGGLLCSIGQWRTPAGFNPIDYPEGHICFDVIKTNLDELFIARDLQKSVYAHSDPNVKAYALQTYIGRVVKSHGRNVGSLCAVYQSDNQPSSADEHIMGIIATAIGREEERRQARNELQSSLDMLNSLVRRLPFGVVYENDNRQIVFCNELFTALFNFTTDDIAPGMNSSAVFSRCNTQVASDKKIAEELEKFIVANIPVKCAEFALIDNRTIEVDYLPVISQNQCNGHIFIFRDVTARKQTESLQQLSERSIRTLYEIISTPGLNLSGQLLKFLKLGCERFQIPLGVVTQFTGENLKIVQVYPENAFIRRGQLVPFCNSVCQIPFKTIKPFCIHNAQTSDWKDHPGFVTLNLACYIGAPILVNNKTYGTICFMGDQPRQDCFSNAEEDFIQLMSRWIGTEIERLHAETYHREINLALANAMPGIATLDLDGVYESVNPAYAHFLGNNPEDMIGRHWHAYLNPEDIPVAQNAYRQMMSHGQAEFEAKGIHRDSREFHKHVIMVKRCDDQGIAIGYYCFMRDITDRMELEEKLRQAQKMEAIGRLAGGIAHDFNNLLVVINGYSSMLQDKFDASDSRGNKIKEIFRAGQRAAALTKQLLFFSRRQVIKTTVVNLNQIISNLVNMLKRLIGEHIQLQAALTASPDRIMADVSQIEQIIMNLVVNARDAMPNGGVLTIKTDSIQTPSWLDHELGVSGRMIPAIRLSVHDNGQGMNEATRRRIFEPFFTTKVPGKGTGLGMSVVYGIIMQSNGKIEIQSELGTGTVAVIHFPLADENQISELPVNITATDVNTDTNTILVVEDEDVVLHYVCDTLHEFGYKIIAASNADEALRLAKNSPAPIHLLLSDIIMPGMNGVELAEQMKFLYPHINILFMSGYTDDMLPVDNPQLEAAQIVYKPFTPDVLELAIRQSLNANGSGK